MPVPSLTAIPCSSQNGKGRLPRGEKAELPRISKWRSNLTALSQYRNLYFVALVDRIHVYQPSFPQQNVPLNSEVIIIELPASRPGLVGYIDYYRPQGVNQLAIRDLGEEEVLIIACDGGDVYAFSTRSIEQQVQEKVGLSKPEKEKHCSIHPLLHSNVGASAWGIDVHKTARLIAFSSNSHDIVIYAFALSSGIPPEQLQPLLPDNLRDADGSTTQWVPAGNRACRIQRSLNSTWALTGHGGNIPAIAFYNRSNAPNDDVILVSTDIDGYCFVWDALEAKIIQRVHPYDRGWGLACIDPATSRVSRSEHDTYNCTPEPNLGIETLDISTGAREIPDSSTWHPEYSKYMPIPQHTPSSGTLPVVQPEVEDEDSGLEPVNIDYQVIEDEVMDEAIDEDIEIPAEHMQVNTDDESVDEQQILLHTALQSLDQLTADVHRLQAAESRSAGQSKNISGLPCNFLLTGESDICLLDSQDYSREIICKKPLVQTWPPGHFSEMQRFKRLNMIHQIPELGVIAVGDQLGRVGLLTTTFWAEEERSGFKLETILPLRSEEEQDKRPTKLLLGMAISPIQGQQQRAYSPLQSIPELNKVDSDRFRLLMYYYDHTILAYEISRPSSDSWVLL